MLQSRYPREELPELLLPLDQWKPFPPSADRDAWKRLTQADRYRLRAESLIASAEELRGEPWPALPATLYMDYARNGDRESFQRPNFARRTRLATLVLAECFQHEGRFLDEIINGIWAICEEATWCLPAHSYPQGMGRELDILPRQDREIVDLFAAQTAMDLSEACYLLADELDALTPVVRERVRREALRRVVDPVLDRGDFSWMTAIFNWNTWCSSCTLGAGLYLLDDPQRTADLVWAMMGSTDAFLAGQLPDGGCSEGPGYWGAAPGAMLNLLELLHSRSDGRIDVYSEPLIADLGRYIARVHLDGPWFAPFSDCPPRVGVATGLTYRYGERIGDADMCNLALLGRQDFLFDASPDTRSKLAHGRTSIPRELRGLFWVPGDATPEKTDRPLDMWLRDLGVLVARETPKPGEGLVLAIKGGHNGEHHNHNDVGQSIILLNGQPMIVDVGINTYTRKTFGPQRYEIWCIRGSAHNAPIVNGSEQAPGRSCAARDLHHEHSDSETSLSMDLAPAYGEEASIRSLRRVAHLRRGEKPQIALSDHLVMDEGPAEVEIHFFSPATCEIPEPGRVVLETDGEQMTMEYDPAILSVELEPWPIEDERLSAAWKDSLTRLTARGEFPSGEGAWEISFRPA
jgi:heparinase II/III-like protein